MHEMQIIKSERLKRLNKNNTNTSDLDNNKNIKFRSHSRLDQTRERFTNIIPKIKSITEKNEKELSNIISKNSKNLDIKNLELKSFNSKDLHNLQRSVIQNCGLVRNVIMEKMKK